MQRLHNLIFSDGVFNHNDFFSIKWINNAIHRPFCVHNTVHILLSEEVFLHRKTKRVIYSISYGTCHQILNNLHIGFHGKIIKQCPKEIFVCSFKNHPRKKYVPRQFVCQFRLQYEVLLHKHPLKNCQLLKANCIRGVIILFKFNIPFVICENITLECP